MRTLPVIAVNSTDTVGPTRLRLLTAGSSKLPVVVVATIDGTPAYYVFDVAALQAAMTNQLSPTPLADALDLDALVARAPVTKAEERSADAGSPVVENGRLVGIVAEDEPERKEPGEEDMNRGAASTDAEPAKKRGLWQRLSRSGD